MATFPLLPLCVLSGLFLCSFGNSLPDAPVEKVKLDLYYETLCPGCSGFMVNHLPKIFRNGLIDIVHLNLVPYGNAKRGGINNENITCQHGADECLLNTVEACAIHVWPELKKHYAFLYCVENLVVEGKHTEWASCYQKTGLDPKPVTDCTNSDMGKQLELKYANETENLVPPHKFVPWVIVDGQPLGTDGYNFMKYICKAYKGRKPKACKHLPPWVISEMNGDEINQVCQTEAAALP